MDDLLKPHVRKNALLKAGNKNDRVDARKLSDLLRAGLLTPAYHGESGARTLRELSRGYLAASKDLTRSLACNVPAFADCGVFNAIRLR